MNLIMYGFQRVTRATTIARRVVTESRPSTNTRQKIVGTLGEVTLNRRQVTLIG
jgi:hypothetical protein